ncbi:hypothetical protein [Subdoligranulum variabile]|uniref:hypothetical protein n=1 Tax=Subdoligranulum variabile TaxID=214851 RepID=UPI0026EC5926|nr:hypothetical protein [Subdoligranulum variabile]
MLLQHCKLLDPGQPRRQALAQRVFCAALALLLILSEVFSSNIQSTLPSFSHLARLALTGGALLLLGAKIVLLTDYQRRWQPILAGLVVLYTAFTAWHGDDIWFLLAALIGLGAKDVDLHAALRVYLITAVVGLVFVQLLHFATPLMPYNFYCRNWDFGYGHYNGFGARLVGVFFAWAWLRHDRLHWFDWLGLSALFVFTYKVPGSRGAAGAMAILLLLFAVQRFFPKLFDNKIWYGLVLALPICLAAFSLYAGYVYNPEWPYERMALLLLSIFLSGRFEIWHNVFWGTDLSWLGGLPTDGDEHHAIDNAFLAIPMNKGYLGAILLAVFFLLLLWRLAKHRHATEMLCLVALMLYIFMENKPFLLSANPFLLLAPCVFFTGARTPAEEPLPVVCKRTL